MESLSTRTTLLSLIRDPSDHAAWREFEKRYCELLVRFCRGRGLQLTDAEDVVQSVFASLSQSLPQFVYDPRRGRFRDYLFRCSRNAIFRWAQRPGGQDRRLDTSVASSLPNLGEPSTDEAALWDDEWVDHHYRLAMNTLRKNTDVRNVEIFERLVAGDTVVNVAARFDVTPDAVHKVKQRLRDRMQELIAAQIAEEDAE
ncbi:MAG TPA: sigma-70 family RNA polymerase sigma factor [Phycisphaerae bacterium]|nr:sigma-70 family RNA polymerase sigma factor [Phycisphaerae bacterium]